MYFIKNRKNTNMLPSLKHSADSTLSAGRYWAFSSHCHVQEWLSLLKSISLHNKRTRKMLMPPILFNKCLSMGKILLALFLPQTT